MKKGEMDKFKFVLMHFPIASWDGMNDNVMHLHGHVHLPKHQRINEGRAMDVGVDGNDMYPLGIFGVIHLLKNQPIKKLVLPKDHHERRL
jgi:calcineurin-like phosphoesterase family protein